MKENDNLYLVVNDGVKNILLKSKNIKFIEDSDVAFIFLGSRGYKLKQHKNRSNVYWEVFGSNGVDLLKLDEIIELANNILIDEKVKIDVEDYGIDVKTRDLMNWCFTDYVRLKRGYGELFSSIALSGR